MLFFGMPVLGYYDGIPALNEGDCEVRSWTPSSCLAGANPALELFISGLNFLGEGSLLISEMFVMKMLARFVTAPSSGDLLFLSFFLGKCLNTVSLQEELYFVYSSVIQSFTLFLRWIFS